jgi:tetratricopeptide (TPR) repeat protein
VRLLTRAVSLFPLDDPQRLDLLPELGIALIDAGRLAEAQAVLREAEDRARATGSDVAMWRARITRLNLRSWTGNVAGQEMTSSAEAAVAACAELGDDLGLARSWHLLGLYRFWTASKRGDADRAFLQALTHARLAAARREESVTLQWMLTNAWYGSTPCSEGLRRCDEVLRESNAGNVEAWARIMMGCFLATRGRFDEARESHAVGLAMLEDLGQQLRIAEASQPFFNLCMLAGDPAAAETRLRSACDMLELMGESGFLGTCLGMLAEAVYVQGGFDDAAKVSLRAEELTARDPSDIDAQYRWRAVRAKVLARHGEYAAAEILAREAVALTADADGLNSRAEIHLDLAEVLQLAGRIDEALAAVDEGLHLYDAKENVVGARRARARRDELTARI